MSTQTVEQAQKAVAQGADYLGVGAVFATQTKADAKPLPHDIVRSICSAVTVPVVAIGGITKQNILQLSGTGVDGVALVSAIFAAETSKTNVGCCLAYQNRWSAHTGRACPPMIKKVLTIAGSDCSGGAGIQRISKP